MFTDINFIVKSFSSINGLRLLQVNPFFGIKCFKFFADRTLKGSKLKKLEVDEKNREICLVIVFFSSTYHLFSNAVFFIIIREH